MVVPINLRSSHGFSQWLRLIAGAYMLAINRYARLLQLLVTVNDHNCGIGISSIFNTVFQYLPIFLTVLGYCAIVPFLKVARSYLYACWLCFWFAFFRMKDSTDFYDVLHP